MIINRNELQKKLKALECAVAVKATIPSQTFLKWDNETMTTTNGYTSVITNIQLGIGDEIKALIPFKPFKQIIDKVGSKDVELIIKDNQLAIKANRARFKLNLGDFNTFPNIDTFSAEKTFKINSSVLKDIEYKIAFCCATEDKKIVLKGLHFVSKENQLTIIGTDAFRLAKMNIPFEGEFDFVIQAQDIINMAKIFSDNTELSFGITDTGHCYFKDSETSYYPTLIDAKYPDTSRLIPNATYSLALDREDLLQTIERISMISTNERVIKIVFEKGLVTISSTNSELGSASESIECNCDVDMTLGCNGAYLAEALKRFANKEIKINLVEARRPFTITSGSPDESNIIMLLLPVRIEE